MAVRCTDEEIREIMDIDPLITNLLPFQTAANIIVNARLGSSSLAEATLKEIERWLSAHFVCLRDPRAASEKAGSVGISYQYKLGAGFNSTSYGIQALLLDTTGTLEKKNATIHALTPDLWD